MLLPDQARALAEENRVLRADNTSLAGELEQMNRVASYVGSRVARVLAGARRANNYNAALVGELKRWNRKLEVRAPDLAPSEQCLTTRAVPRSWAHSRAGYCKLQVRPLRPVVATLLCHLSCPVCRRLCHTSWERAAAACEAYLVKLSGGFGLACLCRWLGHVG